MDTIEEAPLLVTDDYFERRSETAEVDDLLTEFDADLAKLGKLD